MISLRQSKKIKGWLLNLLTWFLLGFMLFPVYQMVFTSVQRMPDLIKKELTLIPSYITFEEYVVVFGKGNFLVYFANSILVALAVTILGTAISAFAGYSLARLQYPGKPIIDKSVLFVYIIPPILLVIPIYVALVRMGLNDTYISVILTHTLFAIPFGTWLMRGFFKSIPIELEDAARVDGASRLTVLLRILTPIAAPGMAAVAIFSFVASWDEFLFASILLVSDSRKTVPIGIWSMVGTYGEVQWGEIMAATTVSAIPMFIFFLFFQKWMVRGLTAGAVK